MPRIQRLLMVCGLFGSVLGLSGCNQMCQDTCQQSNRQCLTLNIELLKRLKAQEQQFNAWAQEIYHNRDYKERQASIVKGCDVLFPVCTDSMTKQGQELIAQGYGGLDSWQVWIIAMVKLIMLFGLGFMIMLVGAKQIDKFINNQQSALNEIKLKREELTIAESELEQRSEFLRQARANLSNELSNLQIQIEVNRQTLDKLQTQKEACIDAIALTRAQHDALKMQMELMDAVTLGLR